MRRLLLASTLFAVAACAGRASSTRAGDARKNDPVPAEKPLYERLGGLPGIAGLVGRVLGSGLGAPPPPPRRRRREGRARGDARAAARRDRREVTTASNDPA